MRPPGLEKASWVSFSRSSGTPCCALYAKNAVDVALHTEGRAEGALTHHQMAVAVKWPWDWRMHDQNRSSPLAIEGGCRKQEMKVEGTR